MLINNNEVEFPQYIISEQETLALLEDDDLQEQVTRTATFRTRGRKRKVRVSKV